MPNQEEKDISKGLLSFVELMPQSYQEPSKRLLTYLTENEHLKIDDKKNEVIIHDKSCSLIDFVSNLIAYRK